MFKIIIPTDFSPAANSAALFAIEIANQMKNVELTFFHCIEVSDIGQNLRNQVGDILLMEAENEMKAITGPYSEKFEVGVNSQYDIVFGKIEKEISKKAKAHQADLIIMGTKGAGGLEKTFIGSVASEIVANTTDCPVLVVPGGKLASPIKKIVYATDMADLKSESKIVIALAKILKAHVLILHVTDKEEELSMTDPVKKAYELVLDSNYSDINFKQAYSLDIIEAIEKFAIENKADVVAMFSRRKSYFERLFDKSLTKEMAFHTHVPLLAIPYELTLK